MWRKGKGCRIRRSEGWVGRKVGGDEVGSIMGSKRRLVVKKMGREMKKMKMERERKLGGSSIEDDGWRERKKPNGVKVLSIVRVF